MPGWETTFRMLRGSMADLVSAMNEMGHEGWEPIQIVEGGSDLAARSQFTVYFKRALAPA